MGPRSISKLLAPALAAAVLLVAAQPAAPANAADFGFGRILAGPEGSLIAVGTGFNAARMRQDGTADPDFGVAGFARAGFPGYSSGRSNDAVVLPGGGVVVGGWVTVPCEPRRRGQHCARRPALARFRASGRLDTGFDRNGRVLAPRRGSVLALAALGSGKLLIAGRTAAGLPMLARYTVSGSLDRAFGDDGVVVVRRLPGVGALTLGRADDVIALPHGEAIASVFAGAPHIRRRGLVRLSVRGRIEPGFGVGGYATATPEGTRVGGYGSELAALPDGRVLVGATTSTGYPPRLALFRLLPDGRIDETYGSGGLALGPSSLAVKGNVAPALEPNGYALAGAAGYDGATLASFLPGGALDTSFADGGITSPLDSWGYRASAAVLSDGTVALADSNRQLSTLMVGLYDPSGRLRRVFEVPH